VVVICRDGEDGRKVLKKKARNKFRDLLGLLETDKTAAKSGELEVTFDHGLKAAGVQILKTMEKKQALEGETTWEKHLRERREKRKARRKALKDGKNPEEVKRLVKEAGKKAAASTPFDDDNKDDEDNDSDDDEVDDASIIGMGSNGGDHDSDDLESSDSDDAGEISLKGSARATALAEGDDSDEDDEDTTTTTTKKKTKTASVPLGKVNIIMDEGDGKNSEFDAGFDDDFFKDPTKHGNAVDSGDDTDTPKQPKAKDNKKKKGKGKKGDEKELTAEEVLIPTPLLC
jgi:hypothetical protein